MDVSQKSLEVKAMDNIKTCIEGRHGMWWVGHDHIGNEEMAEWYDIFMMK